MDTKESFVATLREQIDQKHRDAIQALETIAAYLLEAAVTAKSTESSQAGVHRPRTAVTKQPKKLTRVELVLGAISGGYKPIGEIAGELNLPEVAVRAVLYAKAVMPKVLKKKIDGKLQFRLKSAAYVADSGEEKSAASLVRDLLSRNQDGLRATQIHASLAAEIKQIGSNPAAVGAALYNMKKRGKLLYDEATGVYRLAARAVVAS